MKGLLALVLLIFTAGFASAQTPNPNLLPYQNFCQRGGTTVLTSGLPSSNQVQGSFPKCNVEVFASGTTTHVNLFSDTLGTPLGNPFTANSDGSFIFYVLNTNYPIDVTISGAGMKSPYTYTGVNPTGTSGGGGGGGGGTTNGVGTWIYVDNMKPPCTINGVTYHEKATCAFYTVAANSQGGAIMFGSGVYNLDVCLVEPAQGFQVSIYGQSSSANGGPTNLLATGCTGAMITHPTILLTQSAPYGAVFENFNLDCNFVASAAWEMYAEREGHAAHIAYRNCTSLDHWFQVGIDPAPVGQTGAGYQFYYEDITGNQHASTPTQWAQVTVTGTTPVFTIVNGGTYFWQNPPVVFTGTPNGSKSPCTTPGTSTAVMTPNGAGGYTLTGITSTATGCPAGQYWVKVPDMYPVAKMFDEGFLTDSTFSNITTQGGLCGINAFHGGNVFINAHPIAAVDGICDNQTNKWIGSDMDSSVRFGADEESPNSIWTSTVWTWNNTSVTGYPGSSAWYFGINVTRIDIQGSTCGVTLPPGNGYHLISNASGNFGEASGTIFPGGFNITSAVNCDNQTTENFHGVETVLNMNAGSDNANQAVYAAGTGAQVDTCGYGIASFRTMYCWNAEDFSGVLMTSALNGIDFFFGDTNDPANREWKFTATAFTQGNPTNPQTVVDSAGNAQFTTLNVGAFGANHLLLANSTRDITARGLATSRRIVSANDTATTGDYMIICNAAAGPITETLPAAPTNGQIVTFVKTDVTASVCTLNGNTFNINNSLTWLLYNQFNSVTVQFNGGIWSVTARYPDAYLFGKSAPIGDAAAVTTGFCVEGHVNIPGVTVGMFPMIAPETSPTTMSIFAYVGAPNTVSIDVCQINPVPNPIPFTVYDVRVIP